MYANEGLRYGVGSSTYSTTPDKGAEAALEYAYRKKLWEDEQKAAAQQQA